MHCKHNNLNMLTRVDSDWNITLALDSMLDSKKDDIAHGETDKHVYEKNGRRRLRCLISAYDVILSIPFEDA